MQSVFFLKSVLQGTKHQRDNFERSTWASPALRVCVAREEKPTVFFAFLPSLTPPFHSYSTACACVHNLGKNRGCFVVYVRKKISKPWIIIFWKRVRVFNKQGLHPLLIKQSWIPPLPPYTHSPKGWKEIYFNCLRIFYLEWSQNLIWKYCHLSLLSWWYSPMAVK